MPKKTIKDLQIGVILSLILLITGSIASYISIHKQIDNRKSLLRSKEIYKFSKGYFKYSVGHRNRQPGISAYRTE